MCFYRKFNRFIITTIDTSAAKNTFRVFQLA